MCGFLSVGQLHASSRMVLAMYIPLRYSERTVNSLRDGQWRELEMEAGEKRGRQRSDPTGKWNKMHRRGSHPDPHAHAHTAGSQGAGEIGGRGGTETDGKTKTGRERQREVIKKMGEGKRGKERNWKEKTSERFRRKRKGKGGLLRPSPSRLIAVQGTLMSEGMRARMREKGRSARQKGAGGL